MADNDTTKQAVLYLLARGLATQAEAARLAGTSRQLVRYWAKELSGTARDEYLKTHWQDALRRVKETA